MANVAPLFSAAEPKIWAGIRYNRVYSTTSGNSFGSLQRCLKGRCVKI